MTIDEAYQKGDISGRTFELCYQVTRGAEPATHIGVPRELLPLIRESIESQGCKCYVIAEGGEWISVDIYQADHVLVLLQTLDRERGHVPDAFSQWCVGKLYG